MNHHKHQGQHVLLPPERRAQGEDEGDDHHDGGDQPRLGEHVFQLLNRAHQKHRAGNKKLNYISGLGYWEWKGGERDEIEPAKSCEVPQSVENGKDFQPTQRVEGENEGAQDGAEDTKTKTNTETFDPSVPRQTGGVQGLNKSRNETFFYILTNSDCVCWGGFFRNS